MADTQIVAWTGTNKKLNVQIGTNGTPITLQQTSNNGPAIAYFKGTYYLVWTGTNGQLNVSTSADGINWSQPSTLSQTSDNGPTLAVSPSGVLYLGWTGTNNKLNYMTLGSSGWSTATTINETSNDAYCLIVV